MTVSIAELRAAANLLFDHLERSGHSVVRIDEDYYWSVPPAQQFDVYSTPPELTIGQLSDDLREVGRMRAGESPPLAYGLVWLAAILRVVGLRVVH